MATHPSPPVSPAAASPTHVLLPPIPPKHSLPSSSSSSSPSPPPSPSSSPSSSPLDPTSTHPLHPTLPLVHSIAIASSISSPFSSSPFILSPTNSSSASPSPSPSPSASPALRPAPIIMSLAPFPSVSSSVNGSRSTSSTPSPTSANHSHRVVRPRRSAASLRSIPERKSRELDQPPLPVPPTPWIEPATPGFLNSLPDPRPRTRDGSQSSNDVPDSTPLPAQQLPSLDPSSIHLHPHPPPPLPPPLPHSLPSAPQQPRPEDLYSIGPHTIPGPRDQRSLARYRLASQPLSSRHSEGSQYASSSNWTPSSTTGSRIGFDPSVNGMRSSIASRDSRFTAETDYDDYCHSNLGYQHSSHHHLNHLNHHHQHHHHHHLNHHGPHSQPLNLSVSASWHSGDPPRRHSPIPSLSPQAQPGNYHPPPPTLASLIKLDQARSPQNVVGLGITSDQTVTLTRGSRSPSLSAGGIACDLTMRTNSNHLHGLKTDNRSPSSSISNGTGVNPSPLNPLHSQHSHHLNINSQSSWVSTPVGERVISSKSIQSDPGDLPISHPGNLFIPNSTLGPTVNLNPVTTSFITRRSEFSLDGKIKSDNTQTSLLDYQGLPYDVPPAPTSGRNTPLKAYPPPISTSTRKPGSDSGDVGLDRRDNYQSKAHFNDGPSEYKHRFYQHQSQWDDFDDHSPSLHSSTQIPSQAVALVEDGRGCIVDISTSKSSLEQLEVPEGTTHLLLAKTLSPFMVGALLSSRLPVIAANLVVLDISDAGLNSLPSAIALCDSLEELNISGNAMSNGELPPFLSHLTSLKVLAADRCGLYQVAHSYGSLIHLRDLSVRHNHLRSLPSWLSLLVRLEILLVDGNEFEPPWQELVEPLLSYNHSFRQIPEALRTAPIAPDHPRRNLNGERSARGKRHVRGPNHGDSSASGLDHDQTEDHRPQSVCSEASVTGESPNSNYLRRLRSTSDMHSAPPSRPISVHEQPPLGSLALPADLHLTNGSPESSVNHFRPPSSMSRRHRRPSAASTAPLGHRISAEPQDNGSHLNLPLPASRSDSQALSLGDPSQSLSSHALSLSATSRDNSKKSFGFLKKMSLGKLRREPNRPRTGSIDAFGRPVVYNSLYSKPSSNAASEFNPLESSSSKPVLSDGFAPQECDEFSEVGDSPSKVSQALKSAGSNPTPTHSKSRLNNRRSFLKLEDHFSSLTLSPCPPKPTHSTAEQGSLRKSTSKTFTHSSSGSLKLDYNELQLLEPNLKVSQASHPPPVIPQHWASLRSVMMYLRDVHDLSGDVARVPGGLVASGAKALSSGNVSRALSTKHGQPPFMNGNVFGDGRSTPIPPPLPVGAVDIDTDGLDNPLSNGSVTGSSVVPGTSGPPKVTDNAMRRFKVLEEILATEKSYIKGLKELYDIYITSASSMVSSSIGKEKEPMVPPAERKIVFNNVEAIIGFHVDVLLPDFQEVMDRLRQKQVGISKPDSKELKGPNADQITQRTRQIEGQLTNIAAEELARVFIRHAAFLKLYATYITQFDTALERLREWSVTSPVASTSAPAWTPSSSAQSNNPTNHHNHSLSGGQKKRLKTYMKRCRAHTSHTQMNLESYLLMPVQRLPRYKLLLESLVSCTPELNHGPDREDELNDQHEGDRNKKSQNLVPSRVATEALNIVSAVTAEMNERKRDSEGRQRLLYWQQRFGNKFRSPLVQPHRTLIKEGVMTLMRIVKLTFKESVGCGSGPSNPPVRIRVPVLNTDSQSVAMIVLLCTDLLVLVKDPGDGGRASNMTPASLFQALRLAQHSRPQVNLPATVFGADQTMIRFVDNRAIFYFQCDCQRSAAAWMVAINQQVPLL